MPWSSDCSQGLLRFLQDQQDRPEESSQPTFNPVLFWSVNAIWVAVLATVLLWLCKFNGAERIAQWSESLARGDSDRAYRNRIEERRRLEQERRQVTPEKRRQLLKNYFQASGVQMRVAARHIVVDTPSAAHEASGSTSPESKLSQEVVEPSSEAAEPTSETCEPSTSSESNNDIETGEADLDESFALSVDNSGCVVLTNGRSIPNCCAVCLASYEVNDSVVWSLNQDCKHAFHEECVTDWLIKMQDGNPCPCCRAEFVDVEAVKPIKNIRWEAGRAMNLGVISFILI